jgi:DnaJ-class molecular chaperone
MTCKHCDGSGEVILDRGNNIEEVVECERCDGSGHLCDDCGIPCDHFAGRQTDLCPECYDLERGAKGARR